MEWPLVLALFLSLLLVLIFAGFPVALAFLAVGLGGATLLLGLDTGGTQLLNNVIPTVTTFALIPVPLFILMGELLYHSGLAGRILDAIGKWLGPLPGRLSVLSMVGGATFGILSGSAIANTSLLGALLVPEMRKRGYSKSMSAGPILGAGPLAMVLPPSALAVLVGTIGGIPIGPLLIAGLVPGALLFFGNTAYIVVRCWRNPELAPRYDVVAEPLSRRLFLLLRDVLPMTSVFFVVIGSIVAGWATPSEAAALGALAAFALIAAYGRLTREVVLPAMKGTISVSGMILLIMGMAGGFSNMLAYSGATRGLVTFVSQLDVPPLLLVIGIVGVIIILGAPLEQVALLLITLPLFAPVVFELGYEPVWFGLVVLITMDVAGLTPPLGLNLFVLKGVAPPDFSMGDIIKSGLPYLTIDVLVIVILFVFPALALLMPRLLL